MTTTPRRRLAAGALALSVAASLAVSAAGVASRPPVAPAAAASSSPAARPACTALPESAVVVNVVDGDTIDVDCSAGARARVRIIGINTPETVKTGTAVQCYGPQASQFAHRQLDRQQVQLQTDPGPGLQDLYRRFLAHVYVLRPDGEAVLYGQLAITGGYAEANAYGRRHHFRTDYAGLQAAARKARRGVWRCAAPFEK